jgi:glutamyl-tRNA reductase
MSRGTASRLPVLEKPEVAAALKLRRHRPMFLLDLAVPRDIAADVAELADVYLYTVDDLEQVIEGNKASRREAAQQAEAIIDIQVEHYLTWWQAQGRQDALKRLRADGATARDAALAKAQEQLAQGEDPSQVLQRLAHQLTNRLLHAPTSALRQAALDGDSELLRAAERLFQGDDDSEPAA